MVKLVQRRLKVVRPSDESTSFPLDQHEPLANADPESFARIYMKWREDKILVGEKIQDYLTFHKLTSDVFTANNACCTLYKAETDLNDSNVERTDAFFFAHLGTNEAADFLYSNAYRGFLVRLKMWLRNSLPCLNVQFIEQFVALKKMVISTKYALKVILHYVDIVKDLLILFKLVGYVTDSEGELLWTEYHAFALAIAAVILVSILLTEVSNALIIASHPILDEEGFIKRFICIILTPLMPAAVLFEEMNVEMALADRIQAIKRRGGFPNIDVGLSDLRREQRRLRSFRAEFRDAIQCCPMLPKMPTLNLTIF